MKRRIPVHLPSYFHTFNVIFSLFPLPSAPVTQKLVIQAATALLRLMQHFRLEAGQSARKWSWGVAVELTLQTDGGMTAMSSGVVTSRANSHGSMYALRAGSYLASLPPDI